MCDDAQLHLSYIAYQYMLQFEAFNKGGAYLSASKKCEMYTSRLSSSWVSIVSSSELVFFEFAKSAPWLVSNRPGTLVACKSGRGTYGSSLSIVG